MRTLEAYNLLNFLNNISERTSGLLAFRIAKNIRILKNELTEYENIRIELFKKYGEEVENNIVVKPEKQELFLKELSAYNDESLEAELIKIDDSMLENSNLNAKEIGLLLDYFGKE